MVPDSEFAGTIDAAAEKKNSAVASPSPFTERDQWLDAMADESRLNDRRYNQLRDRITRLESRARLISMPEEMKTFLLMTGISVAAAVLVPMLQAMVEKWRRSQ